MGKINGNQKYHFSVPAAGKIQVLMGIGLISELSKKKSYVGRNRLKKRWSQPQQNTKTTVSESRKSYAFFCVNFHALRADCEFRRDRDPIYIHFFLY